jgi:capsular exopolysaccharide synthesis family protein
MRNKKNPIKSDMDHIASPEESRKRILSGDTSFATVEAYKAVRTNTLFTRVGEGCQKVVVASTFSGEGKSINCINMAITMAQNGLRVLIIDGDMRKPVIQKILQVKSLFGLSEVLAGLADTKDLVPNRGIICATAFENVFCLPSGHVPPNPAELLASKQMENLLNELESGYDYIFIDTPPILVVTDAAVISKYVNGYIMIVRAGKTQMGALQDAISQLEQVNANILGFILNDVESKSSFGKYGYRYGKYGKYGYGYGYGENRAQDGAPVGVQANTLK